MRASSRSAPKRRTRGKGPCSSAAGALRRRRRRAEGSRSRRRRERVRRRHGRGHHRRHVVHVEERRLDGDRVIDAVFRVDPEVRRDERARCERRQDASCDVHLRQPERDGAVAVDDHAKGGVVEHFTETYVHCPWDARMMSRSRWSQRDGSVGSRATEPRRRPRPASRS